MIQCLLKIRCAQRQQRPRRQLPEEHRQPQSAEADRSREIQPGNRENRMRYIAESSAPPARTRRPRGRQIMKIAIIQIVFGFFLSGCDSSSANGSAKWNSSSDEAHPLPAAVQAPDVPDDFLRQIAGPNDQLLRERQVRPEHHEREHQLAQIVQMLLRDQRGPSARTSRGTPAPRPSATSPITPVPTAIRNP